MCTMLAELMVFMKLIRAVPRGGVDMELGPLTSRSDLRMVADFGLPAMPPVDQPLSTEEPDIVGYHFGRAEDASLAPQPC